MSATGDRSGTAKGQVTRQELTRPQQLVARRMAESKAIAPDLVLDAEVEMDVAVRLLEELRAGADGAPPSVDDLLVKACGLALREFARANGAYRDGGFELYSRVNVGFVVTGEGAFVVPTVYDADQKSLDDIAGDSRELTDRARAGTITPPELSNGTFTISNLGAYGIKRFAAILHAPQAATLAVGALTERAVVRDGELTARKIMDVTLTCDHRILYGSDAAGFLARIRELLEQPRALIDYSKPLPAR